MREYDGHKITRAEELARHAYRRELVRALSREAKGSGWKAREGCLFRDYEGWFVQVYYSVTIFWHETEAYMQIKSMGIDPLFWEILGMPENQRQPLSFRAQGAWTCRPVEFARASIDEDGMDAAGTARRAVQWASRELEKARADLTTDGFLARLRASPEQVERGRLTSSLITTLLLAGRDGEAEQACVAAIERGWSGGFFPESGTFPMAALEHIRSVRAARTDH